MENRRVEKSIGKHVIFEKNTNFDDFCMFGRTVRGLKDCC